MKPVLQLKILDNWMMQLLHEHNVDIRVFGCMPYQSQGGRGLVRPSKSKVGGWLEWVVAAQNNSSIQDLVYLLGKNKCQVQLTQLSGSSGAPGLTTRQEEILQFAYGNGYYEYPRRVNLTDLSRIFEVSPSTMSEILRAGQRRIFSEYFGIQSV